jgi:hypothetical protein
MHHYYHCSVLITKSVAWYRMHLTGAVIRRHVAIRRLYKFIWGRMFLWIPVVVLLFLIPAQKAGARSLAADPHCNLYTVGIFIGPSVKLGKVTFMNAGGKDILVAKRDHAGNVIWAYSFGGINDETETGIVSDISGNAYITGHFNLKNSSQLAAGWLFVLCLYCERTYS